MDNRLIIIDSEKIKLATIEKKIGVLRNGDKISYLCLTKDKKGQKSITINNGEFTPCPADTKSHTGKTQRTILYCAGPSQSGKSTIINHFIKNYTFQYPNQQTYIFSKLGGDDSIQKSKNVHYLAVDEENLIYDPYEMTDFKNSLVIMDDVDTFRKDLKKPIKELMQDIGETGRHENVSMCVSSHEIAKNHETKSIISESHIVVMYLSSGYSYDYYLHKYIGLSQKQIISLKKFAEDSRWVAILKQYPVIILTSKRCIFLSDL